MSDIIVRNKKFIKENRGVPWCDFSVYRKHDNLNHIFLQAIRRLIILNKQKRSEIQSIIKAIKNESDRKEEELRKRSKEV